MAGWSVNERLPIISIITKIYKAHIENKISWTQILIKIQKILNKVLPQIESRTILDWMVSQLSIKVIAFLI